MPLDARHLAGCQIALVVRFVNRNGTIACMPQAMRRQESITGNLFPAQTLSVQYVHIKCDHGKYNR